VRGNVVSLFSLRVREVDIHGEIYEDALLDRHVQDITKTVRLDKRLVLGLDPAIP
jgi:hypothetical protein